MILESEHTNSITLAIFPFENLSTGRTAEIFCKSFTLDLTTELSRFKQFQIISLNSIQNLPLPSAVDADVFNSFNTDYYIQGSFRSEQNRIRINAQLITSETQTLVWADRFEGNSEDLAAIQEGLLDEVVSSLQHKLNDDLISNSRQKQKVDFKAYECWLYGVEELKKGSLGTDEKARTYFQRAMAIDPNYSLAYSGMSLTYFNEWSCQLWDRWELSQTNAYEWAIKAYELDGQNYVAAYVLGRIFLYEGKYEKAEIFLRNSLRLNPNDAESLIQIASCFVYLEYTKEALDLYIKALRLNPDKKNTYAVVGVLVYLELGEFEKAAVLIAQTHTSQWVDAHAIFAGVYHHLNNSGKMIHHWHQYLESYKNIIKHGKEFTVTEAIQWQIDVSPYKGNTKLEPFWEFISNGELEYAKTASKSVKKHHLEDGNTFQKEAEFWRISFAGKTVQLVGIKGFHDLYILLGKPNHPIHCAELMGTALIENGTPLIDEKAKKAYEQKILDLQEELADAESGNDLEQSRMLREEYDHLVDHLSQSLGLKGSMRQAGNPIEKALSAVTWRIRKAIDKIEKVHQPLGRHLTKSINTGTLCTYIPEKDTEWIL